MSHKHHFVEAFIVTLTSSINLRLPKVTHQKNVLSTSENLELKKTEIIYFHNVRNFVKLIGVLVTF